MITHNNNIMIIIRQDYLNITDNIIGAALLSLVENFCIYNSGLTIYIHPQTLYKRLFLYKPMHIEQQLGNLCYMGYISCEWHDIRQSYTITIKPEAIQFALDNVEKQQNLTKEQTACKIIPIKSN